MEDTILNGKNVLLTGATGGLGEAIAAELAAAGCNLFLNSRHLDKLEVLAEALKTGGQKVEVLAGDLAITSDLEKIVAAARKRFSRVDILINCAGIFPVSPISEATLEDFDRCFAVNVRAPFFLCQSFLPAMVSNGFGRVVNIGSSSAFAGFKDSAIYCASKHALLGLTRSLYEEMRTKNVRVISINPGSIRTEMGKRVPDQDFNTFMDPRDVARYLRFIISFDSEIVSEEVRLNRLVIK
jgi:NAD(P)-dependent dehydrogenase (short-subunit alcohol dehydrogenase family)